MMGHLLYFTMYLFFFVSSINNVMASIPQMRIILCILLSGSSQPGGHGTV